MMLLRSPAKAPPIIDYPGARRLKGKPMHNMYHRWFRRLFWLLRGGLGGASLMVLLTAGFGQACPVGVPAPPQVALVADDGMVYASSYYSANIFSSASHGNATMLRTADGSRLGDTATGNSFLGASDG